MPDLFVIMSQNKISSGDEEVTSEEVAIFGLARMNSMGNNKTACPVDLIPSISAYLSGTCSLFRILNATLQL